MKWLLSLSLLLIGCTSQYTNDQQIEYAAHQGDRVRVVKGFYKGRIGIAFNKSVIRAGCVIVALDDIQYGGETLYTPPVEFCIGEIEVIK